MPEYVEIACDNCETTHRREKHDCEPDGWHVDGWIMCPECWQKVTSFMLPPISLMQVRMPKLFESLKEDVRRRVAMSLLTKAIEDLRRSNRSQPSCIMTSEVVE